MKQNFGRYTLLFCAALILSGCAGGISKEARSQITYTGPFDDVQKQPKKFIGETVMWGGKIIEIQAKKNATEMIVLQLNLENRNRPLDNDQSKGRFIVHSSQFLDPALYPKGTLITVVGPVKSAEMRTIGEMKYNYPVIEVGEIKKWHPIKDTSPRIHFGFGVGTRL